MKFDHRDTMNTEKTKNRTLGERARGPHRGLRLPLLRSERRRGAGRGGAPHWWSARHGEAPLSPALSPFVPHGARETEALLVTGAAARTSATINSPEGTPQDISRGQARASGRSPRLPGDKDHAPAGHRRSVRGRTSTNGSVTARRIGKVKPSPIARHLGLFLRCPAGAPSYARLFPGAASAAADLPPANLLRCPSGTLNMQPRHETGH